LVEGDEVSSGTPLPRNSLKKGPRLPDQGSAAQKGNIMHPRYSRARRRKQAASSDQLELLFPEIQLELPFESEPSKRPDRFKDFLLRMQQAQTQTSHQKGPNND
jgi:hypothetical protein